MRRIVMAMVWLMSVISVSAQWEITPEAGMNVTKYKEGPAKIGFKAGAAVSYTFESKRFALQSGLYYTRRGRGEVSYAQVYGTQLGEDGLRHPAGFTMYPPSGDYLGDCYFYGPKNGNGYDHDLFTADMSDFNIDGILHFQHKDRSDYLQIPILARFNWAIGKDVRMHVAAGPYFAMAVGGKLAYQTVDWKLNSLLPKPKTDSWDPYRNGLSRFDWGTSLEAGIEVRRFMFKIGYDLGLGDLSGVKYHTASFTIGYTF